MQDFPTLLRNWRQHRRFSQLELAAETGISSRHLSFLETGRARPSREMLLRLAETLDLPRREINEALTAAGFAKAYERSALDDLALAPVRAALVRLMQSHLPYPAVMMDREWTVVDLNDAAARLFAAAGIGKGTSGLAILDLPGGPSAWVENWPEVGHHLLSRLRRESRAAGGIETLDRFAARLEEDEAVREFRPPARLAPMIPTIYRAGELRLSLFSTFLHIGGGEDLTLDELRLEMMFPMDEATKAALDALA